jgi:hypothetical protein
MNKLRKNIGKHSIYNSLKKKIKYLGINLIKDVSDQTQGELQTIEERD